MKKLFYIMLFAITTAMTITACTEDEVTPNTAMNGGGNGSDPK